MTLSRVCTIQIGLTARGRLEPSEHGNVWALQLRDVPANGGGVAANSLTCIRVEPVPEKYLVRAGDVVFRSRGERNTAAVIGASCPAPALAVLPLMIVRPDHRLLNGAYLAWVMNQQPAQRHFEESAQGTSLRMIPRSSLESLEIPVPSLETQQRIVDIDALAERERLLAEQLTMKRQSLIHRVLIERAKERTNSSRTGKKTT